MLMLAHGCGGESIGRVQFTAQWEIAKNWFRCVTENSGAVIEAGFTQVSAPCWKDWILKHINWTLKLLHPTKHWLRMDQSFNASICLLWNADANCNFQLTSMCRWVSILSASSDKVLCCCFPNVNYLFYGQSVGQRKTWNKMNQKWR